ncbi:MAG TPA: OmpA family protein [Anaeromyxobacter sp.]|nr:OmpA family protein [Anaeromyxobacter sp.]
MRRNAAAVLAAIATACATERAAEVPLAPQGEASVLKPAELARVRCLVVAPFENGSDAPLAAEAATGAMLSAIDPARTRVFPIPELRGIFKDTPLDLPQGLPPSLALELAELVGADAALWGSVEGRGKDGGELLVTIRLSLVGDHQLLFADTVVVRLGPGDRTESSIRRSVLEVARPMLARLGDPGRKRCFEIERIRTLRKFALAETPEAKAAKEAQRAAAAAAKAAAAATPTSSATPAATPAPPPEATASAASPAALPAAAAAPRKTAAAKAGAGTAAPAYAADARTPRQTDWSKRLAAGGRVLVEDVAFAGRTAQLQRDGGLADLAVALLSQPAVTIRLEGFVDATADRGADAKLSTAMAQAAAKRLGDQGVPKHRITWAGRGGESPILPNFTARGRAANRRIEAVALR